MEGGEQQHARARSPEERRSLAVMIAVGISILLFVIWLAFFFIAGDDQTVPVPNDTHTAAPAGFESLRDAFRSLRATFDDTAAAFSAFTETAATELQVETAAPSSTTTTTAPSTTTQ